MQPIADVEQIACQRDVADATRFGREVNWQDDIDRGRETEVQATQHGPQVAEREHPACHGGAGIGACGEQICIEVHIQRALDARLAADDGQAQRAQTCLERQVGTRQFQRALDAGAAVQIDLRRISQANAQIEREGGAALGAERGGAAEIDQR